jgi:hypothetical protein
MEQNVGIADRYVRIVLGLALGALGGAGLAGYWATNTVIAAVLLVVGVVFLGTGLTRSCLLYRPFGINTNR